VATTDFNLQDEQKTWLLDSGHTAAREFLGSWDPSAYVNRHGRGLAR
jgi:hypothetical protein